MNDHPWVVVRCRNDMPLVVETLRVLTEQTVVPRILFADNASSDGSREAGAAIATEVLDVPEGEYNPGRVLNAAMERTDGEFVVFLNSDCTPTHATWLEELLHGFPEDRIAAVFGRQDPRPGCHPLFAKDTYDTFGDGSRQQYWKHCFSMASSAIRRSVWEMMPFRTDISYSEDIDWTWRARQNGFTIRYVPDSVVYHSHNYTMRQWYRRQHGEGKADAGIFTWEPREATALRYSILPYGRQVLSDWWYAIRRLRPDAIFYSPILRLAQALGRRRGFREGREEYGA